MQSGLYIKAIRYTREAEEAGGQAPYYHSLSAVRGLQAMQQLRLQSPVTIFVGENGSGKSTLLEAVAVVAGFNPEGGTRNFHFSTFASHSGLWEELQLVRGPVRERDGFFLRAESYYNVASEIERLDGIAAASPRLVDSYGGRSLHEQSHGESFMALVMHRLGGRGLYIFDEPEAALSPTNQMALLARMHELVEKDSQFFIATHSPLLMAYPGADVLELGEAGIHRTPFEQTGHYQIMRRFLNDPAGMLRSLLDEPGAG